MSDYKGAALMLPAMPKAKEILADKGYDANWLTRYDRCAHTQLLANPPRRRRRLLTLINDS